MMAGLLCLQRGGEMDVALRQQGQRGALRHPIATGKPVQPHPDQLSHLYRPSRCLRLVGNTIRQSIQKKKKNTNVLLLTILTYLYAQTTETNFLHCYNVISISFVL